MKWSFKIAEVSGISINIHLTFFLLLFLFGKYFFLAVALFFFITLHELAHSLVAKKFGIQVREITLLPIGGVASMTRMPENPFQEFLISIAGPLTNIAVVVIFYLPLRLFLGTGEFDAMFKAFWSGEFYYVGTKFTLAWIYWMNLVLALFNLIPAFPMDGGRILRAVLVPKFGFQTATKIAVNFGIAFAIFLVYVYFTTHNFLTLIVAVFLYMAASSEEVQVDLRETLKKFRAGDIIPRNFITVKKDATLSSVLEIMFTSRQEDFPVMDENNDKMVGFMTRFDIINGIHKSGVAAYVSQIMRTDIPAAEPETDLDTVQQLMQAHEVKALPVVSDGYIKGVITMDDISRAYTMLTASK